MLPWIKEQCFFTFVRHDLEYASSLWDTNLKEDINDIDDGAKIADRIVLKCYNAQIEHL